MKFFTSVQPVYPAYISTWLISVRYSLIFLHFLSLSDIVWSSESGGRVFKRDSVQEIIQIKEIWYICWSFSFLRLVL